MQICPLLHHHDKKIENKEDVIYDKDNFDTPPATNAPNSDTPNASA